MLPIRLPLEPMLARSVATIPPGLVYEPKWDGWRALLARDGDRVEVWSRHGTDLSGFFPELEQAALAYLPEQCVLDGEIVIIRGNTLDYTLLAARHSSRSRAARLAREIPASLVAFDLLAFGETSLLDEPWRVRRELLETLAEDWQPPLLLSPVTRSFEVAQGWFEAFEGAGLDGVVAKGPELSYQPGRRGHLKIKHRRTTDVVVGGFRYDRTSTPEHPQLGSLLLGLFDDSGALQFLGVCAGFPGSARGDLARTLSALEITDSDPQWAAHPWSPEQAGRTGARVPEGLTRWSQPREQVHLISPMLVCEVDYDYVHAVPGDPQGTRFRSTADFRRWRPERTPESCHWDQLELVPEFDLREMLDLS
ncbi:ATP-dependent DNA ligase [Granulicoccus phenolivorans]|uniref:ATP-dependent DNA ligase n=1 Tax=Granulicoccus phenolivorans TaxID=266854 RepID=UPI000402DAE5|nr:ATP-dependent DNA ligase [Granulicoccus phenolivorans]